MKVGVFGTETDYQCFSKIKELIGAHAITPHWRPVQFWAMLKARLANLDCAIISCPTTLECLVRALPDFHPSYDLRGQLRKIGLMNYQGSLIHIPGYRLGRETGVDCLIVRPWKDLYYVPEATFLTKRFLSKLFKSQDWLQQPEFKWTLCDSDTDLELAYEAVESALLVSIDIETDVDNPDRTINCVGYGVLGPNGSVHCYVVPFTSIRNWLVVRRLNVTPSPKVLQGGDYDHAYFLRWGCPVHNYVGDTLCAMHCWYAELDKDLAFIAAFSVREIRYWKDDGKTGDLYDYYEYNARDCYTTLLAFLALIREMPDWAHKNMHEQFKMFFPCFHVSMDGLRKDVGMFEKKKAEKEAELEAVDAKIKIWFGEGFNPRSPIQVPRLLKILGVPNVTNADEKALNAASALHPFNLLVLDKVLEWRGYAKLLSTYFPPNKFWTEDRLLYRIAAWATDTNRQASRESAFWCGYNIQNIPERDTDPGVKDWLCSDDGWYLFEADNSQSEAYCTAYITGCEALREVLEGPHDFHCWNASKFFGIPYERLYDDSTGTKLNKTIRDTSKRTNHGANYNMGADVLLDTMGPKAVAEAREMLNLPKTMALRDICQYLLDGFDRTYPEIRGDYQVWIKRTIGISRKITTALGWTRYFFGNPSVHKPSLNAAVAHAPQNTSVMIINRAFYNIWHSSMYGAERIRFDFRDRVRLKAQIHDSILGGYKDLTTPLEVREIMQQKIQVTDIKGKTRTMEIPVEVSYLDKAGNPQTHWKKLK